MDGLLLVYLALGAFALVMLGIGVADYHRRRQRSLQQK
jgi:hypothetical protein